MPNIHATEENNILLTTTEQLAVVENDGEAQVIEVDPQEVRISGESNSTLIVLAEGPPGPVGAQGIQGTPGAPGAAGSYFVWTQGVPASTWTITHDLNKRPSVTIVDSTGRVVVGQVDYVDDTHIIVTFVGSFSGIAYLN
jgi:hypothetical protein